MLLGNVERQNHRQCIKRCPLAVKACSARYRVRRAGMAGGSMSLTPEQYREVLQQPDWLLQVVIPGKDILFERAPFSDEALRDVCEHMVSASVRECVIIMQGTASDPAPVRSRTGAVE